MRSIVWEDGDIVVLDQTLLPHREEFIALQDAADVAEAITSLRVRGAPAIGIVAAYGIAQAAIRPRTSSVPEIVERVEAAAERLRATRPTAVNLAWAIDRMLRTARQLAPTAGHVRLTLGLVEEAQAIHAEDAQACDAMAQHAQEFFPDNAVVLTHCNTGFLCTGGIGTALGAIRRAAERGSGVAVLATETRPLLQGARLTSWELARLGIPAAIVVDSAAAGLIARGEVALVIVGADRIAANGDVANKVGTYGLALAASAAGIPFVVVAPTSTVDLAVRSGAEIEIEERSAVEVTTILGVVEATANGVGALNPAFDVTPGSLITAIVTERGVARPPYSSSLSDGIRPRRSKTGSSRAARPAAGAKKASKPERAATTSAKAGARSRAGRVAGAKPAARAAAAKRPVAKSAKKPAKRPAKTPAKAIAKKAPKAAARTRRPRPKH